VDLVRDLLDKRLVDRNGREMGRVDRIMLQVRAGAPPRVAMLEVGPSVLASRLHPVLGRVVAALEYACGVHEGRPVRVAFHDVIDVHDHVRVDDARPAPAPSSTASGAWSGPSHGRDESESARSPG
jgi:sporulation protein YlmC with PRC-barrel domain